MTKRNLPKSLKEIITISPQVKDGKPCFKDTRIPVYYVLNHLRLGWSIDEVYGLFPEIKRDYINKAVKYLFGIFKTSSNEKDNTRIYNCR